VRVLVTGCAGFIGSHLCEKLLEDGHLVVGVDAFTEYYDPGLKFRNLERCLDSDGFRFERCLITGLGPGVLEDAELIFHIAAQPGVRASWGADFETYLNLNVLNTQYLLERVRRSRNLKRLLYASSSSVYGNTSVEMVREDHAKAPYSPYGVTKLAAEQLCSLYEANFGVPAISLRLFTVFGPRQRPDMFFSNLISAALTGRRFVLHGDGAMQRDFTSVFDIVDAFKLAAQAPIERGTLNISGGKVVSINEAIETVEDLMGKKVSIERQSEKKGDVRRTAADISEAFRQLGYYPRRGLRDSLRAQIEFTEDLLTSKIGLPVSV
jgi:nucleoside-diphosphate-sugar epimerase